MTRYLHSIISTYFKREKYPPSDGGGWDILVGANTGGFESLRGQLFVLVGDHVHAGREVVDIGLLTSKIEDTDLWVRDTTVETGLGIGLLFRPC